MKQKLSRIRSPWRRLAVSIFITCLLAVDRYASPRANIHWIGHHRRPRRIERPLIIFLLLGGMLLLTPREYILLSTISGGLFSFYVILQSFVMIAFRKQYHWVKS